VSNVCKSIDHRERRAERRAVPRKPRVHAPDKLIGLHRPLHITRIYISALALEPVSAFPASISLLLECPARPRRNPRNFTPSPLVPLPPPMPPCPLRGRGWPWRPIEKTGPVRAGVSNVCGRDEMQTGAILFIVRRLYTYRRGFAGRAECRQGRIYLLCVSETLTS
jgi:hypothetical protein